MFRIRRYAVIAALVLGIAFPVVAQEATDAPEPTATVEVTPEPTPAPVPPSVDVPSLLGSLFTLAAIGVGFFVAGGFSLAAFVVFLSRKDVQDQLEKAYESADPATQERIRAGYERADKILDEVVDLVGKLSNVVDKVTDRLPNTEPPSA